MKPDYEEGRGVFDPGVRQEPGLGLETIRQANISRLPHFKNAQGEPGHSESNGSDWSLGEWMCATAGELGEAANIIKKIRRGDFSLEEARVDLGKELADTLCYLDILAFRAGINLSKAYREKFNAISLRVGSPVHINSDNNWGSLG